MSRQPELLGIFGLSVHERIAKSIASTVNVPGQDAATWRNHSESILPVYQDAIQNRGYDVYTAGTTGGIRTLNYVIGSTGLPATIVTLYLMALQDLAQSGKIDTKIWNPGIREAQMLTAVFPSGIPAPNNESFLDPLFKPLEQGFNKVLLYSTIGLVVFFFGKELLRYGTHRTSA